jgi:hypothetical protein
VSLGSELPMRCSADQVSLNIEGIERVSASSRLTKSTVVKKRPRELARERGSAARCHYLQAKLANGTKPSREDRDRKNPVTTDQMSWSNSTEREDINRFDPARQPALSRWRVLLVNSGISQPALTHENNGLRQRP